jgi:hypothetical protein
MSEEQLEHLAGSPADFRMRFRQAGGQPSPWVNAAVVRRAFRESFGELEPPGGPTLAWALTCGWVHAFLWGLGALERSILLGRVLALGPWTGAQIAAEVARLALKGWEDFPLDYPQPPIALELESELKEPAS